MAHIIPENDGPATQDWIPDTHSVTNIILLDNVGFHKVSDILNELQMIEPGVEIGSQQLATSNLHLLFLPAYSPFLNPIEEVGAHTLPAENVAKFYGHTDLFLPVCLSKQPIN
ncbi:hypothetical protein DSO57_1003765 [Entomophthora muscae]|uniref:Uncharacterized protein n=1 Tax=Entomophthora muscae TaxID=34485 RepID=A0ACC2TJ23_9FUNG|nr:hypothetical protein DSO57_1003765 [Entomophthora muscae]